MTKGEAARQQPREAGTRQQGGGRGLVNSRAGPLSTAPRAGADRRGVRDWEEGAGPGTDMGS